MNRRHVQAGLYGALPSHSATRDHLSVIEPRHIASAAIAFQPVIAQSQRARA